MTIKKGHTVFSSKQNQGRLGNCLQDMKSCLIDTHITSYEFYNIFITLICHCHCRYFSIHIQGFGFTFGKKLAHNVASSRLHHIFHNFFLEEKLGPDMAFLYKKKEELKYFVALFKIPQNTRGGIYNMTL